jgi:hypothetical protein
MGRMWRIFKETSMGIEGESRKTFRPGDGETMRLTETLTVRPFFDGRHL